MKSIALLFLFAIMPASQLLHAQLPDNLDAKQWAKAFSDKNDKDNTAYRQLDSLLNPRDSSFTFRFLNALEKEGKPDDNYFQARFNLLKARAFIWYYNNRLSGNVININKANETNQELATAMEKAYSSEDDYLIALVSFWYSRSVGDIGLKILYSLNTIALSEKLSLFQYVTPYDYNYLAELLYNVREYNDCIKYSRKSIEMWEKTGDKSFRLMDCLNTIALAYQKQKRYDSAIVYYKQALQNANKVNDPMWIGIISGNIGQIYYEFGNYDTARSLITLAYEHSLPGYCAESANALQWLSRTDLALGRTTRALFEVREAFGKLRLSQTYDPGYYSYLRNTYYAATMVFKAMKEYDSAFYFNNLYTALNDSLEQLVAASSLSITRARMNDLNSRNKIQALNREKQSAITTRNIMVSSVVFFAIIALLLINRKRLKTKLEKEKAQQEKALVQHEKMLLQQEMVSAQQQLKMFTENIVEKSALIEKLQQQQETRLVNQEQDVIVQELVQQSILTEADWLHFKTLFEKAHPGFFPRLKAQSNDITLAEIRMAALTRMQLTTQQMANVLGISANSIVKAKQRLRLRFNLQTNYEVEEFMQKL